ncbi:MAG: zinc ribbon domain-containing protein [archaeon]|nr:zinc ribbon domain-containing protein [archaeon]
MAQVVDTEIPYLLGTSETMLKVLSGLHFKGGSSSINSLKIAVMLDEKTIKQALDTAILLKLVEYGDDKYSLTDDGEVVVTDSENTKREVIGDNFLQIEAYKDIVYRMKMTGGFIKEKDASQAFYILSPDIREEIRKQVLNSFASFGIYTRLFEDTKDAANPGWRLTKIGAAALDKAVGGKKSAASRAAPAASADLSCGSCGKAINPDFAMCPYCGTPQKAACSNCGKDLQAGWKMCPFCGTPR